MIMRVLVIAGFADSLLNFRGHLLDDMTASCLDVHVAAPALSAGCKFRQHLEARGFTVHSIPLRRTSINPFSDLYTLWVLRDLMIHISPDAVLGYTMKPVIYGTLAACLAGVRRRYALITGLGYAFSNQASGRFRRMVNVAVKFLLRLALSKSHKTFFQNPDDQSLFVKLGLLAPGSASVVLNGSGVDLITFSMAPLPSGSLNFLLIARLLGDKGVYDYVKAARRIKASYPQVTFSLVGWIDESPDAISKDELSDWVSTGTINYLGRLDDVRSAIAQCSVYVLPSYREGTPRTVLEAMAMGRAVITCDAPGCRETVVDGDNGFLVPIKSPDALVDAMLRFIDDPDLARRMGQRSRVLAEKKYDVHKVNDVLLKEMSLR